MKRSGIYAESKIAIITAGIGIASREYLMGVFRYANAQTRWTFEFHNSTGEFLERHRRISSADGILSIIPHTPTSLSSVSKRNLPTVIIDSRPSEFRTKNKRLSFLHLDDTSVGESAAKHLLSRGSFNAFACMIDVPDTKYPYLREEGFRRIIEHQGKSVATFTLPATSTDDREREDFILRLARLPRPLAVFAVRDHAALAVYEACRRLGLSIPEEIAVLGVDNDELFCNTLPCALSSIHLDHEQVGFLAAKELDRLLSGGEGSDTVFTTPVKDIVMRASTRIIPPTARIVSGALAYIERNATGTLRVSDIATHLNISRRLLDLRFRQMQNESVLEAIMRTRISRIKKLLSTTSDSITKIAKDCGFSSSAALVRFFKHRTGFSPDRWRQKHDNNNEASMP